MTSSCSLIILVAVIGFLKLQSHLGSCCDSQLIVNDIEALRRDLEQRLHGQHLAQQMVIDAIKRHLYSESPEKALVLSFQGLPGVGKSFVSQLIASNLYQDGLKNPYVHFLSATNDFPHGEKLEYYKAELKRKVETSIRDCKRSMFIIDEADKLPPSLLETLTLFLENNEAVEGVDYREAIFIFLSVAGGTDILDVMLKRLKNGRERESLTLEELENNNVMLSTYYHADEDGQQGLQQYIIACIPFLPLEKEHVRDCIKDDLVAKDHFLSLENVRDKVVDDVMEVLGLQSEKHIFSPTGCKRVSEKVDYVMTKLKLARYKYAEL